MLALAKSVGHRWSAWEFAVGSETLRWLGILEASSLDLKVNGSIEHVHFLIGVGIIDKFGVVIIILSWLHEWLVGYRNSKLVSFSSSTTQTYSNMPRAT